MNDAEPNVYIGIPTGPPKKYSLAYMFAALQNLDWPNKQVHFAVTCYKDDFKSDNGFYAYIWKLKAAVDVGCKVIIHTTEVDAHKFKTPYGPVLANLQLLRGNFLDGDFPYFLLLGGDNPPPRATIRRLMKLDADVACGLLYQRPKRGFGTASPGLPMMWRPAWTMDELDKFDLPPEILDEFRVAFIESSFLIPLVWLPNWRRRKTLGGVVAGSGCTLIKKHVLERVGFHLPRSGYHSEDINFFTNCLAHNYEVKADLKLHIPHFDPDGSVY